jgi:cytochrome b pre-mRNA-processing protein 3
MLRWLRERIETGRRARELYGSVVATARQAAFYGIMGVPDTPEGRYELVALHLYLALESLRADARDSDLKQRLIEVFVNDMDDCMREMGVGDMAVPKKIGGSRSSALRCLGRECGPGAAARNSASKIGMVAK